MSHAMMEWIYVGVVTAILVYIGASAWEVERFLDHPPADAQVIRVTGSQWFWAFEHEDGTREIGELHLQKGVPYKFEITATDVNHSFNIHELSVLMDAIPGRITTTWVFPDVAGEFLIQCREYCGFSHYQMHAKAIVVDGDISEVSANAESADIPVVLPETKSAVVNN